MFAFSFCETDEATIYELFLRTKNKQNTNFLESGTMFLNQHSFSVRQNNESLIIYNKNVGTNIQISYFYWCFRKLAHTTMPMTAWSRWHQFSSNIKTSSFP